MGSPSLLEEKNGTLEETRRERERGLWMRHRKMGGGEVGVGRWGGEVRVLICVSYCADFIPSTFWIIGS